MWGAEAGESSFCAGWAESSTNSTGAKPVGAEPADTDWPETVASELVDTGWPETVVPELVDTASTETVASELVDTGWATIVTSEPVTTAWSETVASGRRTLSSSLNLFNNLMIELDFHSEDRSNV